MTGSRGLHPALQLIDSNDQVIAESTADLPEALLSAAIEESGTYRFRVKGVAESTGDYAIQVLVNGNFKSGEDGNDNFENPQVISAPFVSFGDDILQTTVVNLPGIGSDENMNPICPRPGATAILIVTAE